MLRKEHLLNEIINLKVRIAGIEEQIEQEFHWPQKGDVCYMLYSTGRISNEKYFGYPSKSPDKAAEYHAMGNLFPTYRAAEKEVDARRENASGNKWGLALG